jgi:nitrate reductase (NAD(P)H)
MALQDTNQYTFSLPPNAKKLGLGTCQHLLVGFDFSDRLVTTHSARTGENGTFDLVVKTYRPDKPQLGGQLAISWIVSVRASKLK